MILLINYNLKRLQQKSRKIHCLKSAQIRSFLWSLFFYIRTEYRKIRTRKNSVFGHFSRSDWYQVYLFLLNINTG